MDPKCSIERQGESYSTQRRKVREDKSNHFKKVRQWLCEGTIKVASWTNSDLIDHQIAEDGHKGINSTSSQSNVKTDVQYKNNEDSDILPTSSAMIFDNMEDEYIEMTKVTIF